MPGECHWASALPRVGGSRGGSSASGSRGPQPTANVPPDQPLTAPSAPRPPDATIGKWYPVSDLALITKLDDVGYMDGWHDWEDGDKVLVGSNTRFFRTPQPRYYNSEFPTHSTYARFLEHGHEHGFWWQLEDHVDYVELERSIGYPVECLIHVFHRPVGVEEASPTENKTRIDPEAPLLSPIGESQAEAAPIIRRRRVVVAEAPPEEIEYGEEEPEIPPVAIGENRIAIPNAENQVAVPEDEPEEVDKSLEVVEWSSLDLGTTLRELKSDNQSLVTRALRKLHLRWWHASATRMDQILRQAGLSLLPQVKAVVDTCRICRAWKKPSSKSMSHITQAQGFNERIQMDLLFVGDYIIPVSYTHLTLPTNREV